MTEYNSYSTDSTGDGKEKSSLKDQPIGIQKYIDETNRTRRKISRNKPLYEIKP